jgi:hypothetical protein
MQARVLLNFSGCLYKVWPCIYSGHWSNLDVQMPMETHDSALKHTNDGFVLLQSVKVEGGFRESIHCHKILCGQNPPFTFFISFLSIFFIFIKFKCLRCNPAGYSKFFKRFGRNTGWFTLSGKAVGF